MEFSSGHATRLARGWDREIMNNLGARARTLTKRLKVYLLRKRPARTDPARPFHSGQKMDMDILGRDSSTSGVFPVKYGKNLLGQKGTGDGACSDPQSLFLGSKREERSFEKGDSIPFKPVMYWKNSSPAGVGDRIPLFRIKKRSTQFFFQSGEKTA